MSTHLRKGTCDSPSNDGTRVQLGESVSFIGVTHRSMNDSKAAWRSHPRLTKAVALELPARLAGSSIGPITSSQPLSSSEPPCPAVAYCFPNSGEDWGILAVSALLSLGSLLTESCKPLPPRRNVSIWWKLGSNTTQPFPRSFLQDSTTVLKDCLSLITSLCGSREPVCSIHVSR